MAIVISIKPDLKEFDDAVKDSAKKMGAEFQKTGIGDTFRKEGKVATDALSRVDQSARSLAQTLGSHIPGPLGRAVSGFTALSGAATLGATAALAAGAGLLQLGRDAAAYGIKVDLAARQTNLSTAAIQALSREAQANGGTMATAANAIQSFTQRLGEARGGNKELGETFRALGVDTKDYGLTTETALNQVLKKFNDLAPSITKSTLANKAFGDQGAESILTMKDLEGGLTGLIKKYQDLGLVMDQDGIQQAREFDKTTKDLTNSWESFKLTVGGAVLKDLNESIVLAKNVTNDLSNAWQFMVNFVNGNPLVFDYQIRTRQVGGLIDIRSQAPQQIEDISSKYGPLGAGPPVNDPRAVGFRPPAPTRAGSGGRGAVDALSAEIQAQLDRVAQQRRSVGDDLSELIKSSLKVAEDLDVVHDQLLVLERAGKTKREEFLKLKRDELSLKGQEIDVQSALNLAQRTLPQSQIDPLSLIASIPNQRPQGFIQANVDPLKSGRDYIGIIDDGMRATEAFKRALEDLDQERQGAFDSIARSQLLLNDAFSVDPLKLQSGLLEGIVGRMKTQTEILRDAALGAMDTVFDFVDRGFSKLTSGLGAFGHLISQVASDITRLFLSRGFAQLFGVGGGGGSPFNIGGGGGSGGIGGFFAQLLGGGARAGGFGGFNLGAGGGAASIGIPGSISAAGSLPLGVVNRDALLGSIPSFFPGAGGAGGLFGGIGGLGALLGPAALGATFGIGFGGSSRAGQILGGLGGAAAGVGALFGASVFGAGGGLAAAGLAALGPIALIAAPLIVGAILLGKASQRKKDEKSADEIWVHEMNEVRRLVGQVNSDRIDGQEALIIQQQLRAETIAGISQIKTKSVRESRLTNQLRDLDNGVVSELRKAVERQAQRQRIGPLLVPEFATGGKVQGIDRGFDSVLALLRPGEAVLTRQHQALLGGSQVLQRLGVPGFDQGGRVPSITPSPAAADRETHITIDKVTIEIGREDAARLIFAGVHTSTGERAIIRTVNRAKLYGRSL